MEQLQPLQRLQAALQALPPPARLRLVAEHEGDWQRMLSSPEANEARATALSRSPRTALHCRSRSRSPVPLTHMQLLFGHSGGSSRALPPVREHRTSTLLGGGGLGESPPTLSRTGSARLQPYLAGPAPRLSLSESGPGHRSGRRSSGGDSPATQCGGNWRARAPRASPSPSAAP